MNRLLTILLLLATLIITGCGTVEEPYNTTVRLINTDGDAFGLKEVNTGLLGVASQDYTYGIVEGDYPDHLFINKFGFNPNVAATDEAVWSNSTVYNWDIAADQLEILSSSINDNGVTPNTGARTLEIYGHDTSYNEISELVTINGTGVVTTTKTFLPSNTYRAIVRSAGAGGSNVGTLTIRSQDTNTTVAFIDIGKNQTLTAKWTVPAGYTAYITAWYGGSTASKDTEIALYLRPFGEVFQVNRLKVLNNNQFQAEIDFPEKVTEKSDIVVRAKSSGAGGVVSAGFFLWYEKN